MAPNSRSPASPRPGTMYPRSFSRSSSPAVTTRTFAGPSSGKAAATRLTPSGAASRQIAVTAAAPRQTSMAITVCSVPPVQDEGLPVGQVRRQARGVGGRDERLLVADQPDEADIGLRQQPRHAVER